MQLHRLKAGPASAHCLDNMQGNGIHSPRLKTHECGDVEVSLFIILKQAARRNYWFIRHL